MNIIKIHSVYLSEIRIEAHARPSWETCNLQAVGETEQEVSVQIIKVVSTRRMGGFEPLEAVELIGVG